MIISDHSLCRGTDQPDHLEKVWFVKNGILYVVTTLPEDEAWLTDILTTWRFVE